MSNLSIVVSALIVSALAIVFCMASAESKKSNVCKIEGKQTYIYGGNEYPCK